MSESILFQELEELAKIKDAAIREAEREQCYKDICPSCQKGITAYKADDTWKHDVRVSGGDFVVLCAATAIRERAAEETE